LRLGGKYGFIDATGQWVIEPRFKSARPFHNGRAIVSVFDHNHVPTGFPPGPFGAIDRRGRFVIEPTLSEPPSDF
jgi:hypothetical protein